MVVKATMRAAIYIRVSTEEQANEGFSIEAQKRRLLSYADSQDWEVAEVYIDDGWSAKDLNRPEMKRMMKDVENHLFDVVLVYKLDRMTRSSIDCDQLLKLFEQHSVKFQSCTESFETRTATGRLFIRLVADIAQWERENIAERVRFGMEQMVLEGRRPGGPVPFGYDKDGKTIIPNERNTLRLLRKLYLEGDGLKAVALKLNNMGLLRRGRKWGTFTVWYALDNPYYAGKIRYGAKKSNGKYASRKKEGVVDLLLQDSDQQLVFTWEEYEEHQAEMKRRAFKGHSKVREYWFTGVLTCGKCGSKMSGRYHQNKRQDGSYKKILSYICTNRQEGKGCTMPMFRQELVEKLIMEHIESITLDNEQLQEIAVSAEMDDVKDQRILLEQELAKIRERRKKWQRMYADDLIDEDELRSHTADEKNNEQQILKLLAEMPQEPDYEASEPNNLLFRLPDLWDVLDDKEKHDLILDIFDNITLHTPLDRARGRKGKFIPASIESVTYK